MAKFNYDQCVAHNTRGKHKGERCTNKGNFDLFHGKKFKVCAQHYNYYLAYYCNNEWVKDLVVRSIRGRYSAPG